MAREIGPVTVQGKALRCLICSHDTFWEQNFSLSTPLFSFLDPDSNAHCAVCERCGHVHMFLPKGTVRDDETAAQPTPPPSPQMA